MLNIDQLNACLIAAAKAAHESLSAARYQKDKLLNSLHSYEVKIKAASILTDITASDAVKKAINDFNTQYDELRNKIDTLIEHALSQLETSFKNLEEDANFVTVMLFGRTKTGKSTTMEALTGGDGNTIGYGKQHTTKETKAYYFPPLVNDKYQGPSLRIVDTPGIEGFEGNTLEQMAENFIERADHIFFLLSDDKATADELERFSLIRTQGKGVSVLLNVKCKDNDLDLLKEQPDLIFKKEQLYGHCRRIRGFLENHFDISAPIVIPFHARAAWLGKSCAALPDDMKDKIDRLDLLNASRISEVEARLVDFIQKEAVFSRIRSPQDLLKSYILGLKNELCPIADKFETTIKIFRDLQQRFKNGTERAYHKIDERFPLLRSKFQSASVGIPGLVDEIIAEKGGGDTLRKKWPLHLMQYELTDVTKWFIENGQDDFNAEFAEDARTMRFDYPFSRMEDFKDFDQHFDEYHRANNYFESNKYTRAALRTGAGAGASVLTAWAVANFWNPSGWAAAGAMALVAAAGLAGQKAARYATNEWENSSKMGLIEKRTELITKLREQLWNDHSEVQKNCKAWLHESKNFYSVTIDKVIETIYPSAWDLRSATIKCINQLDELSLEIDYWKKTSESGT